MPMLYRSPVTRWILALVGAIAGLLLIFGGAKWRTTPSLSWLAHAHIPLTAWGAAFLLYALLLIAHDTTRPVGYALGAVLYAVFTVSLLATIPTAGAKSIVGLAAMVDATVFHVFSIRTAWLTRELR